MTLDVDSNGTGSRFYILPIAINIKCMDTTIQIQHRRERDEALATALGHVVLKFLTIQVNAVLASAAVMCLFVCLISEQYVDITGLALCAWVLHLAVMLTVDIAKGGART